MKKYYHLLVVLGIAATSLTSCSRSNYAFNPVAPAYLGSQPVREAAHQPVAPTAVATVRPTAPAPAASPVVKAEVATNLPVVTTSKPAKLSLVKQLVIKKVSKQLAKIQSKQQNVAGVEHTASKAGRSAIISLVGLALILLGAAVNSGLIVTIGVIAFLVGLILLIVHLVSGD